MSFQTSGVVVLAGRVVVVGLVGVLGLKCLFVFRTPTLPTSPPVHPLNPPCL